MREYTQTAKITEAYHRLVGLEVDDWKNIPKCVKSILKDIVLLTNVHKEDLGIKGENFNHVLG